MHIFRNLDLKYDPLFEYKIKYFIGDKYIQIDSNPERVRNKVNILVNGNKISYNSLKNNEEDIYLPKNVFGYYSGINERFKDLFNKHHENFYRQIIRDKKPPLRPLFYAENSHAQFVLLAFFSFDDIESEEFLKEHFGILEFEKATFVLKKPHWYNKSKGKDDLFWGAGGVVRTFLEDLYSVAESSPKKTVRVTLPKTRSKKEERMELIIHDISSLKKLANMYGDNITFFKMLESTLISDLISELKISVKTSVEKGIEFKELSEGERQLLIVLGLLKFMKEEESLFLLDEPDTHLNPKWKYEYFELLNKIVGENPNSHLIITTHDPLLISGLKKEQIIIFSFRDLNRNISISHPKNDPIGYGYEGLVAEFFGLNTTLDRSTLDKLNLKKNLISKGKLSKLEEQRLNELNSDLNKLGFNFTFRDPLYNIFLQSLKEYEKRSGVILSEVEKEEQTKIASEIVNEIMDEQT